MASWKEERDRLVAQTLAFVQQVAAAHPASQRKIENETIDPTDPAPAPVTSSIALPEHIVQPETEGASATPAEAQPGQRIIDDLPARISHYASTSERNEIRDRVAAFKEHQSMLNREREAYYEAMQARIRSSLLGHADADRL